MSFFRSLFPPVETILEKSFVLSSMSLKKPIGGKDITQEKVIRNPKYERVGPRLDTGLSPLLLSSTLYLSPLLPLFFFNFQAANGFYLFYILSDACFAEKKNSEEGEEREGSLFVRP